MCVIRHDFRTFTKSAPSFEKSLPPKEDQDASGAKEKSVFDTAFFLKVKRNVASFLRTMRYFYAEASEGKSFRLISILKIVRTEHLLASLYSLCTVHKFPSGIIGHCNWFYFRSALKYQYIEEFMVIRGIVPTYETELARFEAVSQEGDVKVDGEPPE